MFRRYNIQQISYILLVLHISDVEFLKKSDSHAQLICFTQYLPGYWTRNVKDGECDFRGE